MRRYDDPVDVRRGQVTGAGGELVEGPEQFVWRDRLWKVHAVVAQWVETGPWWQSSGVHAVLGAEDWTDQATDRASQLTVRRDLCDEREVWRVEADRGLAAGRGVFDLVLDWPGGGWRLTRCLD